MGFLNLGNYKESSLDFSDPVLFPTGRLEIGQTEIVLAEGMADAEIPTLPFVLTLTEGYTLFDLRNAERVLCYAQSESDNDQFTVVRDWDNYYTYTEIKEIVVDGNHLTNATTLTVDDASELLTFEYFRLGNNPQLYRITEIDGNDLTIDPPLLEDINDNTEGRVIGRHWENSSGEIVSAERAHTDSEKALLLFGFINLEELQDAVKEMQDFQHPDHLHIKTLTLDNQLIIGPQNDDSDSAGMVKFEEGQFLGYDGSEWHNFALGENGEWSPPAGASTGDFLYYTDPTTLAYTGNINLSNTQLLLNFGNNELRLNESEVYLTNDLRLEGQIHLNQIHLGGDITTLSPDLNILQAETSLGATSFIVGLAVPFLNSGTVSDTYSIGHDTAINVSVSDLTKTTIKFDNHATEYTIEAINYDTDNETILSIVLDQELTAQIDATTTFVEISEIPTTQQALNIWSRSLELRSQENILIAADDRFDRDLGVIELAGTSAIILESGNISFNMNGVTISYSTFTSHLENTFFEDTTFIGNIEANQLRLVPTETVPTEDNGQIYYDEALGLRAYIAGEWKTLGGDTVTFADAGTQYASIHYKDGDWQANTQLLIEPTVVKIENAIVIGEKDPSTPLQGGLIEYVNNDIQAILRHGDEYIRVSLTNTIPEQRLPSADVDGALMYADGVWVSAGSDLTFQDSKLNTPEIKIGEGAGLAGTIKWNDTLSELQWNDGESWNSWPISAAVPTPSNPGYFMVATNDGEGSVVWEESDILWIASNKLHTTTIAAQTLELTAGDTTIILDAASDSFSIGTINPNKIDLGENGYITGTNETNYIEIHEAIINTLTVTNFDFLGEGGDGGSIFNTTRIDLQDEGMLFNLRADVAGLSILTNLEFTRWQLEEINQTPIISANVDGDYEIGDGVDTAITITGCTEIIEAESQAKIGDHWYKITEANGVPTDEIYIKDGLTEAIADNTTIDFYDTRVKISIYGDQYIQNDLLVEANATFEHTIQIGEELDGIEDTPGMIRYNGDFQGCIHTPGGPVWRSFTLSLADGEYSDPYGSILWWDGSQWLKNTSVETTNTGVIKLASNSSTAAVLGAIRYNADTARFEGCTDVGVWTQLSGSYSGPSLPSSTISGSTLRWNGASDWVVNSSLISDGVKTQLRLLEIGKYEDFYAQGRVNKTGGYEIGATNIAVDGFGETLSVDQEIKFYGDDTVYTIIDVTNDGSITTAIEIDPSLVEAVNDNTIITVQGILPRPIATPGQIRYNQNDFEGFIEDIGWVSFTGHLSVLPRESGDPWLKRGDILYYNGTYWETYHDVAFLDYSITLDKDTIITGDLDVDRTLSAGDLIIGDATPWLSYAEVDPLIGANGPARIPGRIFYHPENHHFYACVDREDGPEWAFLTSPIREELPLYTGQMLKREGDWWYNTTELLVNPEYGENISNSLVTTMLHLVLGSVNDDDEKPTGQGWHIKTDEEDRGTGGITDRSEIFEIHYRMPQDEGDDLIFNGFEIRSKSEQGLPGGLLLQTRGVFAYHLGLGYDTAEFGEGTELPGTVSETGMTVNDHNPGDTIIEVTNFDSQLSAGMSVKISDNWYILANAEGDPTDTLHLNAGLTEAVDAGSSVKTGSESAIPAHPLVNQGKSLLNGEVEIGDLLKANNDVIIAGRVDVLNDSVFIEEGDLVLGTGSIDTSRLYCAEEALFGSYIRIGHVAGGPYIPVGAIRYSTPGNVSRGDWEGWDGYQWVSFTAGFHGQAIWNNEESPIKGSTVIYDPDYEGGKYRNTNLLTFDFDTELLSVQNIEMEQYLDLNAQTSPGFGAAVGRLYFDGTNLKFSPNGTDWIIIGETETDIALGTTDGQLTHWDATSEAWLPTNVLNLQDDKVIVNEVFELKAYEDLSSPPIAAGGQLRYNQNDYEAYIENIGWVSLTGHLPFQNPDSHTGKFLYSDGDNWVATDHLTLDGDGIWIDVELWCANTVHISNNLNVANNSSIGGSLSADDITSSTGIKLSGIWGADDLGAIQFESDRLKAYQQALSDDTEQWWDITMGRNLIDPSHEQPAVFFSADTNSFYSTEYLSYIEDTGLRGQYLELSTELRLGDSSQETAPAWGLTLNIEELELNYYLTPEAEPEKIINFSQDTITVNKAISAEAISVNGVLNAYDMFYCPSIGFIDQLVVGSFDIAEFNHHHISLNQDVLVNGSLNIRDNLIINTLYGRGYLGIGNDDIDERFCGIMRYTGAVKAQINTSLPVDSTTIYIKNGPVEIVETQVDEPRLLIEDDPTKYQIISSSDLGGGLWEIEISPALFQDVEVDDEVTLLQEGDWQGWDGANWISFTHTTTIAETGAFDSLSVGGGYGDTGVTISHLGDIEADGNLIIEGTASFKDHTYFYGTNKWYDDEEESSPVSGKGMQYTPSNSKLEVGGEIWARADIHAAWGYHGGIGGATIGAYGVETDGYLVTDKGLRIDHETGASGNCHIWFLHDNAEITHKYDGSRINGEISFNNAPGSEASDVHEIRFYTVDDTLSNWFTFLPDRSIFKKDIHIGGILDYSSYGYDEGGVSILANGDLKIAGDLTVDGTINGGSGTGGNEFDSIIIGGGYGDTGLTIDGNGDLSTDGNILGGEYLEANNTNILLYGGYGDTGLTVTPGGNVQTDGNLEAGDHTTTGVIIKSDGTIVLTGDLEIGGDIIGWDGGDVSAVESLAVGGGYGGGAGATISTNGLFQTNNNIHTDTQLTIGSNITMTDAGDVVIDGSLILNGTEIDPSNPSNAFTSLTVGGGYDDGGSDLYEDGRIISAGRIHTDDLIGALTRINVGSDSAGDTPSGGAVIVGTSAGITGYNNGDIILPSNTARIDLGKDGSDYGYTGGGVSISADGNIQISGDLTVDGTINSGGGGSTGVFDTLQVGDSNQFEVDVSGNLEIDGTATFNDRSDFNWTVYIANYLSIGDGLVIIEKTGGVGKITFDKLNQTNSGTDSNFAGHVYFANSVHFLGGYNNSGITISDDGNTKIKIAGDLEIDGSIIGGGTADQNVDTMTVNNTLTIGDTITLEPDNIYITSGEGHWLRYYPDIGELTYRISDDNQLKLSDYGVDQLKFTMEGVSEFYGSLTFTGDLDFISETDLKINPIGNTEGFDDGGVTIYTNGDLKIAGDLTVSGSIINDTGGLFAFDEIQVGSGYADSGATLYENGEIKAKGTIVTDEKIRVLGTGVTSIFAGDVNIDGTLTVGSFSLPNLEIGNTSITDSIITIGAPIHSASGPIEVENETNFNDRVNLDGTTTITGTIEGGVGAVNKLWSHWFAPQEAGRLGEMNYGPVDIFKNFVAPHLELTETDDEYYVWTFAPPDEYAGGVLKLTIFWHGGSEDERLFWNFGAKALNPTDGFPSQAETYWPTDETAIATSDGNTFGYEKKEYTFTPEGDGPFFIFRLKCTRDDLTDDVKLFGIRIQPA